MSEAVNLDCLPIDELRELSQTLSGNLARYARLKTMAVHLRLRGNISLAFKIETTLDRIYDNLPESEKW